MLSDMSLKGKIAVVTGAAQGIGNAVSRTLAENGSHVVLIDLNDTQLKDTCSEINAKGGEASIFTCDVSDEQNVTDTVKDIVAELDHIDILVNCAGVICENVSAEKANMTDFDRLINVNLKGTFQVCKAVAPYMMKQRYGKIVNIASQAAMLALPHQSIYTASKGGITALTRSLAIDWAPYQINVNSVAPTFIKTPMAQPMLDIESVYNAALRRIPLGRIGEPQDIANVVSFLASDLSSLMTGQTLCVDGGWTAGEPELEL